MSRRRSDSAIGSSCSTTGGSSPRERRRSIVRDFGAPATVSFTDADIDVQTLRRLPGVDDVVRDGVEVRVIGSGPVLAHVGAHLVALGRPPLDLRVQLPTLEECFVALTHDARRGGIDMTTTTVPPDAIDLEPRHGPAGDDASTHRPGTAPPR